MQYALNYSGTGFRPLKIKITQFPNGFCVKRTIACKYYLEHDIMSIFLDSSRNNKTAAIMVSQTNPVGVELISFVKAASDVVGIFHNCWPRLLFCFFKCQNLHKCGCRDGLECRQTSSVTVPIIGTVIPVRQCMEPEF